jgi:hypothetical protein
LRARDLLTRYRPHLGLIACRSVAVILFSIAGAYVATAYLEDFLLAVIVGAALGVALGLVNDWAAVAYGRRLGRTEITEHQGRQAASRGRHHATPAAAEPAEAPAPVAALPRAGVAGASAAAATFAQTARATTGPAVNDRWAVHAGTAPAAGGGSRLMPGNAPRRLLADRLVMVAGAAAEDAGDGAQQPASLDEATAIGQLRDLMLAELRPEDLMGQQGRGVIQLAHELGPRVPLLDPETVVAYVSDHVLVAAGQDPETPQRWHNALDTVPVLVADVATLVALGGAQLLGIPQAANGADPGPLMDKVVHVIRHSGIGLGLSQLCVALNAKGLPVGPYALAGVVKHLVDQGRLQLPHGAWRYTLTDAELERRVDAGADLPEDQRPPLDVVWSVLNGGPAEGMALAEVATEVARRREMPCNLGAAAAALDALVRSRRAEARDGRFLARNPLAESLISGPGLRERIQTAVAGHPSMVGLTAAEITERVNADGFGAAPTEVRAMCEQKVAAGDLVKIGDRYQEPPF